MSDNNYMKFNDKNITIKSKINLHYSKMNIGDPTTARLTIAQDTGSSRANFPRRPSNLWRCGWLKRMRVRSLGWTATWVAKNGS